MFKILKGAKLFDGTGKIIENSVVIIDEKGKIERVGKSNEVKIPTGEKIRIYDVNGKFLLPGLIDAHIHIGSHGMADTYAENLVDDKLRSIRAIKEMETTLRSGFTTVRNCGSPNYIDFAVKEAVDEGWINGPRILTSGKILSITCSGSEFFSGLYLETDGYDGFKRAAREQLKMGADLLKVMATGAIMNPGGVPGAQQPDLNELQAIVEEGNKLGKRVAAHAHGAQGIKNAVRAGVATIEHASLADEEAIELMVANGVYVVTTLVVGYFILKYHKEAGIHPFLVEKTRQTREVRVNTLKRAIEAGVKIAMGSDAGISPYNYHGKNAHELLVYVKEGLMTEEEAIISATRTAAEACGIEDKLGTLEEGKLADVIVVDGNPLNDIEILTQEKNILLVFKEGKLVKKAKGVCK